MMLDLKVFQNFEFALNHIVFIFFSILFLIVIGPIDYFVLENERLISLAEVLLLVCLSAAMISTFINFESLDRPLKHFIFLCFSFVIVLIMACVIHISSLFSINHFTVINVVGEIVKDALRENPKFLCWYLYFPVLVVWQIYLYRKLEMLMVVRILAGLFLVSTAVLYYQSFVDHRFLNNWQPWTMQVNGLAYDPNAFSLSAFLITTLLGAGFSLARKRLEKILCVSVVGLVIGGLFLAGGRTAVGGLCLLILSWPLILAIANHKWSGKKRILIGTLPFLLAICLASSLPLINDTIAKMGIAGKRIADTYTKIEQHGILDGLFSPEEARGELFRVAFSLIEKSPLAGWGPWGFHREYPNEIYLASKEIKPTFDMVLNHYLMIAVDFGIPMLALNMLLLITPLLGALLVLKNEDSYRQRLAVATLIIGNGIFLLMISVMPPDYFPDVIWIWTGQLAFLAITAAKNDFALNFSLLPKIMKVAVGLVVITTIIGTYQTSFGDRGYQARSKYPWWPATQLRYDFGCYPVDRIGDGIKGRWCGQNSILQIPLNAYAEKDIEIQINNEYPDLLGNPVVLQYGGKEKWDSEIVLKEKGPRTLKIPLSDDHVYSYTLQNGKEERYLVVSFNPSRTWIPYKYGVGDNKRRLGILVTIPEL